MCDYQLTNWNTFHCQHFLYEPYFDYFSSTLTQIKISLSSATLERKLDIDLRNHNKS